MSPLPFFWSLLGPAASFGGGGEPATYVTPASSVSALQAHNQSVSPGYSTLPEAKNGSHWEGWPSVQYMFTFGDSYSATHFNQFGDQPSPSNPLGNPPFPGVASCDGSNYIADLSAVYNQSLVMVYNLAYGGATVNRTKTRQLYTVIPSGVQQVQDTWFPAYVDNTIHVTWTPTNALFGFWFGINDIISTVSLSDPKIFPSVVADYMALLRYVYAHGGRNFLVFNVPAIERAPAVLTFPPDKITLIWASVRTFNELLAAGLAAFETAHPDAKVFFVDAHSLFAKVLADPQAFPETRGLRNTTAVCVRGCVKEEYFWHDGLHPRDTVHRLVARVVSEMLTA